MQNLVKNSTLTLPKSVSSIFFVMLYLPVDSTNKNFPKKICEKRLRILKRIITFAAKIGA